MSNKGKQRDLKELIEALNELKIHHRKTEEAIDKISTEIELLKDQYIKKRSSKAKTRK